MCTITYAKLVLTEGLIFTFEEVIYILFGGYGLMLGDTYFNANVTNEAIYFGGNNVIYVPNMRWGFIAAHSRVVSGGGVGYNASPP